LFKILHEIDITPFQTKDLAAAHARVQSQLHCRPGVAEKVMLARVEAGQKATMPIKEPSSAVSAEHAGN
jgi:hypothetical protein